MASVLGHCITKMGNTVSTSAGQKHSPLMTVVYLQIV